jgi:two-component system phosphate regulon sensor histidine kinase PhoR
MSALDDERPSDSDRAGSGGRGIEAQEERLRMIQRDLSEAYRRLEELENAKAQFVLTLTHELRSPVAAIQSLLKAIPFAGELPEKARDLLRRADERVMALVDLVNDLLDLAKERHDFGAAAESLPVDLGKVLQSACAAHQGRAEEKRVELRLNGPEAASRVLGDPEELERLFGNLVGNAVNYTPEGGRVRITAKKMQSDEGRTMNAPPLPESPKDEVHRSSFIVHRSGGWVEVAVADTGIGIPKEGLRRLFEAFYRAPNAKRMLPHGTGLGLAICKRIVEAHRGEIEVESEEGVGTTFTVRLPLATGS